ncbi:MAG: hypothetical protein ACLQBK_08910 [Candidatus Sulfotelmatobacter sp.]
MERNLFPETRFRLPALACLLGSGCSAIYVASHHGSQSALFAHARDLVGYLGIAFCIFVLFYLEHYLVRRFTTCKLDDRLARWQRTGSAVLILAGVAGTFWPRQIADLPDDLLFVVGIVGEFLFVWNVIQAFASDEIAGIVPSPVPLRDAAHGADNFGWPRSPVKQFSIAAWLFAAGGIFSVIFNVPSVEIQVPVGGEIHLMRFGWLVLAAAIPFGAYSRLYKVFIETWGIEFDDSLSRVHFAVTIFGVILVIWQWEQSVMFRLTSLPGPEALSFIAGLSVIVFVMNAHRGFRRRRSARK